MRRQNDCLELTVRDALFVTRRWLDLAEGYSTTSQSWAALGRTMFDRISFDRSFKDFSEEAGK